VTYVTFETFFDFVGEPNSDDDEDGDDDVEEDDDKVVAVEAFDDDRTSLRSSCLS
jgi:hypothetical protein